MHEMEAVRSPVLACVLGVSILVAGCGRDADSAQATSENRAGSTVAVAAPAPLEDADPSQTRPPLGEVARFVDEARRRNAAQSAPPSAEATGDIGTPTNAAPLPASPSSAAATVVSRCIGQTRHELDILPRHYQSLVELTAEDVALCRQAVQFEDSARTLEHLGRALLTQAYRPPGVSDDEVVDVMLRAAQAGSLWAQSYALLLGSQHFSRPDIVQHLRERVAAEPQAAGPRVLLAQTLMVVNGKMGRLLELREAYDQLFAAAQLEGGPSMVSGLVHQFMSFGFCGRLVPLSVKTIKQPKADFDAEENCAQLLSMAGDAGEPMANLSLGLLHLRNAYEAGDGRKAQAAQTRFEGQRTAAKKRLTMVVQSNSPYSSLGESVLADVDTIRMKSELEAEQGARALAGIAALILASPSTPQSSKSYQQESDDYFAEQKRRDCEQRRLEANVYSDTSGGQVAAWSHASFCAGVR